MSIERATIDDAQEILVLQKLAYTSKAEIYDDFTIEPLHQTLEEIRAEFADQRFLKFCASGRIAARIENSISFSYFVELVFIKLLFNALSALFIAEI